LLIRHASPDWGRKDIPYDIPPGPPLSALGERQAEALAAFVREEGVVKLYHSPFERGAQTARLISALNGIPCVEDERLAEWREDTEAESLVRDRMASIFRLAAGESARLGPLGLVTHAGPVTFMLQELNIDPDVLAVYRKSFDGPNPLPPAGVWKAEPDSREGCWKLSLAFIP
jgi:phosphohistidine phosphatase SixA